MLNSLKEEVLEYMMKVQVERVIEEAEHEFKVVGDEYHAEVEQFGSGGIPVAASPHQKKPGTGAKHKESQHAATGGVKRKKSRRSRRG